MAKTYNTEPVKQALVNSKAILILIPVNPSQDSVAAGLSLYLALVKAQKSVTIGCASPMTVNFNRLFGVDKIKPNIGNQNLVISFAYPEDSLEKVAYDKDPQNQKFHLTIEPKAGMAPPDPNSVEFSHTGFNADLIFVIGAKKLADLGALFQTEKKLFETEGNTVVNLSNLDGAESFGTVNLYDPTASSASEIMFSVLTALELSVDGDMATNLLSGIESATNNLSTPNLTADSFDFIAQLMRLGAKKGHLAPLTRPLPSATRPTPFSSLQSPTPTPTPQPISPQPQQVQAGPITPPSSMPASPATPSPDWLKPKVFKSSNISAKI